jgi:hypothetical protein
MQKVIPQIPAAEMQRVRRPRKPLLRIEVLGARYRVRFEAKIFWFAGKWTFLFPPLLYVAWLSVRKEKNWSLS